MEIIEHVETQIDHGLTPNAACAVRVALSAYYSRLNAQLQEILAVKPARWLLMRKELKTDKETDMMWKACEMGIKEMRLTNNLKRIDKINSGLSMFIRNAENEARNIH